MTDLQTLSVNAVNPACQIVTSGDPPTLITNLDLAATLYLSRQVSTIAGRSLDSIPIPPQGSIVVDGQEDVFGITAGPVINVAVAPGGVSYFQSQNAPQLIGTTGAFAANATWGPFSFNFGGAPAYTLALTPTNPAQSVATDITIQHLDASGNLVYQEFFGAIPAGIWAPAGTSAVTLIRGNLYGTSIRINGLSASQAFGSAIAVGAINITGGTIAVYTVPDRLQAGAQRLVPAYSGAQLLTPGQLWFSGTVGLNVAAGATNNGGIVAPCQGPVVASFRFTGAVAAPVNPRLVLNFYSVQGGNVTPVAIMRIMSPTIGLETYTSLNMPAALCQLIYSNIDPTVAAVVFANIVAQNQV